MKGMSLFSVCSWMRWSYRVSLPILISLGSTLPAVAEEAVIHVGPNFLDLVYLPMLEHKTVGEIRHRENLGVEAYVRGIGSCEELLAIPKGAEPAYDNSQRIYSVITRIKVECWALGQVDAGAMVAVLEDADKLDEGVVWRIREFFETLPGQLAFPGDVLTRQNGSTVGCNHRDLCALSAPDESEWGDYSMHFHLFLVDGDRKYIAVMDSYEGRPGFVFGVVWSDSKGRVLDIFPRLN